MTWFIIGIALLIWVLYDLFSGTVWSYRKIYRREEPVAYWFTLAIWFVLAIGCIIPYLLWY